MVSFSEEYAFWELAHYLVVAKGYRLVQLSRDQKELWLEAQENKGAQIIRLVDHNLDWGNWLQRDMELTAVNGERIRKTLANRELTVINIYITPYPPVDDYEFRIAEPLRSDNGKVEVRSFIVDQANHHHEIERIGEVLGWAIPASSRGDYTEEQADRLKQEVLAEAVNKAKEEKSLFEYGKPFLTYVFIFIQLAMFLWLELNGGSTNTETLVKYGAKFNPLILEGEWWRFFTPIFLHIGLLHLAMNTLALYYLGALVERIYGNTRFLFIYLFAGFFGSLASFVFSPNLSAGASGAIFGCFGALLYFGVINPKLFFRTMGMNILVVIGINLAFGFTVPGIDNAGHLGGLAGGFAAAGIVHIPKRKRPLLQVLFLLGAFSLTAAGLSYGYGNPERLVDRQSILVLAQQHIQDRKYREANQLLRDYAGNSKKSKDVLFLLSFTEIKLGNLDEAQTLLKRVIETDPDFHEARYNLALIYLEKGDYEQARAQAEEASSLKPDNKDYQELTERIDSLIGEPGGA